MIECNVVKIAAILDMARYGSIDVYHVNMVAELVNKLSIQADQVDMLIDEIKRIQVANKYLQHNREIEQLCERALSSASRTTPLIDEIDLLESKLKSVITAEQLLHVLFFAPSSPVTSRKADEIQSWYAESKVHIKKMFSNGALFEGVFDGKGNKISND